MHHQPLPDNVIMQCVTQSEGVSGCFRLGNPDLDLKIWISGLSIKHKISVKKAFVADHTNWNPMTGRISIYEIRDKIHFQILRSIGNPMIQTLRSKSGYPNLKHLWFHPFYHTFRLIKYASRVWKWGGGGVILKLRG